MHELVKHVRLDPVSTHTVCKQANKRTAKHGRTGNWHLTVNLLLQLLRRHRHALNLPATELLPGRNDVILSHHSDVYDQLRVGCARISDCASRHSADVVLPYRSCCSALEWWSRSCIGSQLVSSAFPWGALLQLQVGDAVGKVLIRGQRTLFN